MPLFRDVVAAIGIGFERQDWDPGVLRMEAGSCHGGTAQPNRRPRTPRDGATLARRSYGVMLSEGVRCSSLSSPGRRPAGPCNKVILIVDISGERGNCRVAGGQCITQQASGTDRDGAPARATACTAAD